MSSVIKAPFDLKCEIHLLSCLYLSVLVLPSFPVCAMGLHGRQVRGKKTFFLSFAWLDTVQYRDSDSIVSSGVFFSWNSHFLCFLISSHFLLSYSATPLSWSK